MIVALPCQKVYLPPGEYIPHPTSLDKHVLFYSVDPVRYVRVIEKKKNSTWPMYLISSIFSFGMVYNTFITSCTVQLFVQPRLFDNVSVL